MKRLVLLFALAISGCGPSQAQIETAIAQTEAAKPTATAIPTDTPEPTATPDLCPETEARLYDDQAKAEIENIIITFELLATNDDATQLEAVNELINVAQRIDVLEYPDCAKEAQLALKDFADAAVIAGGAVFADLDAQQEYLDEMIEKAGVSAEELDKFRAAAGID